MAAKTTTIDTALPPHSHADIDGVCGDKILERGEGLSAVLPQTIDPFVQKVCRLLEEKLVEVGVLSHALRTNKKKCRDRDRGDATWMLAHAVGRLG